MIESAGEYKHWFDSPQSMERVRNLRGPARPEVWRAVVDQFPECRSEVAGGSSVPLEVLAMLRHDEDEGVRWRVRTNSRWLELHPEDARPWLDDPATLIQFRLTSVERAVLRCGLREWGGPARCTEEFARAMGFDGVCDLFKQSDRIGAALLAEEPLSRTDWTRTLLATEIVFIDNVVGAGWDWSPVTGFSDTETLQVLRRLQRKLVTAGVTGVAFGTRPSPPIS